MATKPAVVLTITEVARRGGINRAKNLTPERRAEIARKAAAARWAAKSNPDPNGTDGPDQAPRPIRNIPSILLNSGRRPKPCHNTRSSKSSDFFTLNLFAMEDELAVA